MPPIHLLAKQGTCGELFKVASMDGTTYGLTLKERSVCLSNQASEDKKKLNSLAERRLDDMIDLSLI